MRGGRLNFVADGQYGVGVNAAAAQSGGEKLQIEERVEHLQVDPVVDEEAGGERRHLQTVNELAPQRGELAGADVTADAEAIAHLRRRRRHLQAVAPAGAARQETAVTDFLESRARRAAED